MKAKKTTRNEELPRKTSVLVPVFSSLRCDPVDLRAGDGERDGHAQETERERRELELETEDVGVAPLPEREHDGQDGQADEDADPEAGDRLRPMRLSCFLRQSE